MQVRLLALRYSFPILLVGSLLLSTCLLWAQAARPLDQMSNQLFSYSVQTGVPQARTNLQLVSGGSPLGLETTQGQSKSAVTFSPRLTGDYRMPTGNKTAFEFRQPTGSAGTMGKSEHFTSSAPNGWLMPAYKVPDRPIHHANGLDHYSQRIPGAGFLIPRVRKQADAHPHVTNVIKMLSPQF